MDAPTSLHFHGPFTFVDHGRGIATCEFTHSAGVYLWVLTDGTSRYVHYVGQTSSFLSRHRDHLIHILSLNYGLFCADAVTATITTGSSAACGGCGRQIPAMTLSQAP